MYRALFDRFGQECVARIHGGEELTPGEARAFGMLLDAREATGRRLLSRFAGDDPSLDTFSGRCGHRPLFRGS